MTPAVPGVGGGTVAAKNPAAVAAAASALVQVGANDKLYPCCGVCCFLMSIDTDCPRCFGADSSLTVCCAEIKLLCCKPSSVLTQPPSFCTLIHLNVEVIPFSVCIKSHSSICCLDSRISIPPLAEEVPCALIGLFWSCAVHNKMACKCCVNFTNLTTAERVY